MSDGPATAAATHLARARGLLTRLGLDGVLISAPADVRYLSGFRGDDTTLLVLADLALICTDSRYWTQVAEEAPGFRLVRLENAEAAFSTMIAAWGEVADAGGEKAALGFQGDALSYAAYRALRRAFAGRLRNVGDGVSALRQVKDDGEVAYIRGAAAIADAALALVVGQGLVGRTESDVAWALESAMHDQGAEAPAFATIVAAGPRGALPHAIPGPRVVARGDLVIIDMGARLDGYHSDITRTFAAGGVGDEQRRVYDVVLRAQLAGLEAAGGGIDCGAVDAAARRVIEDAGLGEQFGHGTGHGVGLEIHEGPRVGRTSRTRLEPGMVVTIEPGVYLPGQFGVRIEDTVVVTATGCDRLTLYPKELQVVD